MADKSTPDLIRMFAQKGGQTPPPIAPDWIREDGSLKGQGFLGPLVSPRTGMTSTELSIGVNIGGKETSLPLLVPTLDQGEINYLLAGNKATPEIIDKAVAHAKQRMQQGLNPFKD